MVRISVLTSGAAQLASHIPLNEEDKSAGLIYHRAIC